AQSFPDKPIRIVVPYSAGGTTDNMARVLGEPMRSELGQAVIIDNKPGAAGAIGAREVVHATPDGYTLFFTNSGILSVTPKVSKNAGFDGGKDFAPVALVSRAPLFLVVPGDLPVKDLKGFIEYAKKQPNPLPYASAGVGSFGHLASELFLKAAGVRMTHVPYKGQAGTTQAIVTGEVKMLITASSGPMNQFIADGKLKLLGVTSPQPSPLAPGTPTIASVLPGYDAETWFALLAPAGTPKAVVDKLNRAINKTAAQPAIEQSFVKFGVTASTTTPEKLGEMITSDIAQWAPIIRDANISAD
ncbi:MAG: tripartite tricarboxylate transporter substrate binding protein, partial [Gammaproteobacteria bacterium]|nr:tripartite tricarboxylate transporter substrate binding protein [Gammaproteobacteria bacterium]